VDDATLSETARRLRNAVEPIAANVYFSPEVHAAFEAIGFGPGVTAPGCLTLPDLPAYYTSRAGCMGQVPGPVVVAAFGVFNPAVIVPNVEVGWGIADRDAVLAARQRGAVATLTRILGDAPDGIDRAIELLYGAAVAADDAGHFLFAGLRSLGLPDAPIGALWRAADLVREHRGDSHIVAWNAAGLDPVEASLMMELYAGIRLKTYSYSRGWTTDDLDEGIERLRSRSFVAGAPVALTDTGRLWRDEIELATDHQERRIVEALIGSIDELLAIIEPYAGAIVAAGGYPTSTAQLPPQWGRLVG
jgi:hypothetical protein